MEDFMATANTINKALTKKDFGHEKIRILYEDEYLCVISKPSGLLSVPYPGSKARTAQSLLEEMMRKTGTFKSSHRPFVVHRLDRDTSGIMMFALTQAAQKKIMDSWHTMVTERLYRAVAENPRSKSLFLPDAGLIDDDLAFNSHNIGFVPKEGDKPKHHGEKGSVYERHLEGTGDNLHFKTVPARTHYKILLRGPTHTLFELSLDTGKKNQIRAHLASKSYPLAGDENYRARTDKFNRLCLHACTLEFVHPYTGKKMKFEENEPAEWREYVKQGDLEPKTPVWIKELNRTFDNTKGESYHSHYRKNNLETGSRHISKKELAHSNFIEAGQKRNGKG